MGKLIRKATGLTVGVATLLAGLVLPMTASAESASPIDASPIIHYSFDNALTSKTIANEGSAANSDATLSGDATVANGQINLTGSQTISVPTTAIAGKKDVTVSIWLKNNYGNGNTAAAYIGAAKTGNYPANGYWLLNPANPSGYAKSVTARGAPKSALDRRTPPPPAPRPPAIWLCTPPSSAAPTAP